MKSIPRTLLLVLALYLLPACTQRPPEIQYVPTISIDPDATFPMADATLSWLDNPRGPHVNFDVAQIRELYPDATLTLPAGVAIEVDFSDSGGDLTIIVSEEYTNPPVRHFRIEIPSPVNDHELWAMDNLLVGEGFVVPGGILVYLESTKSAAIVQLLPPEAVHFAT